MSEPPAGNTQAESPEQRLESISRRSVVLGVGGAAVGLLALAILLAPKAGDIAAQLEEVSVGTLIALSILQMVTLVLRTEAWALTLRAGVNALQRRHLHAASAPRFLADTVVPVYLGIFVRVGILRWLLRGRAPTIGQMVAADGVNLVIEGAITVVLVAIATVALGLPWWWDALLLAITALALGVIWLMRRRFSKLPFVRSFEVLGHPRHLPLLVVLLVFVIAIQPLRFLVALRAVGLDADAILALAAFIFTSLLDVLPIGSGPASVGATTAIFGHEDVAAAAAAALVLLGTAVVAAAVYVLFATVALVAANGSNRSADPQPRIQQPGP